MHKVSKRKDTIQGFSDWDLGVGVVCVGGGACLHVVTVKHVHVWLYYPVSSFCAF